MISEFFVALFHVQLPTIREVNMNQPKIADETIKSTGMWFYKTFIVLLPLKRVRGLMVLVLTPRDLTFLSMEAF